MGVVANDSIIAFDFGTKSIGVAIGQQITCTARPLTACAVRNAIPDWRRIEHLFNEWQPAIVVVGLPLNMDGSTQLLTTRAQQFANCLRVQFERQVILHDERLTTIEARRNLFEQRGYRGILEKKRIDAWSAAIILESWLQQNEAT